MIIAKLDLDELPKTCAYCRFVLHTARSVYCDLVMDRVGVILKEREGDITKRPEWCPLEEVDETILEGRENICHTEERYCDRNLCVTMEVNGKGCDDCPVAQSHNLEDDDSPCKECER